MREFYLFEHAHYLHIRIGVCEIILISIENRIKSNKNFGHVLRAIFSHCTRKCKKMNINNLIVVAL